MENQYIILDSSKHPAHSFKGGGKSWDEVKEFDNIAMIVPHPFIVLDFDTADDAEIMMRIVDFSEDAESFCEFIFLVAFICFSLTVISAADRQDKKASGVFIASGLMTFFSSFVIALPRILAFLTGRGFMLSDASFTPFAYLIMGILSGTAVVSITEKKEIS